MAARDLALNQPVEPVRPADACRMTVVHPAATAPVWNGVRHGLSHAWLASSVGIGDAPERATRERI